MTATIPNLPSLYEPFSTEAKWQKFWEDNQVYKADPNHEGEPYCIVIPPPNVTGSLHMGHAFESALIDTLIRYHRMKGAIPCGFPELTTPALLYKRFWKSNSRQKVKLAMIWDGKNF